MKNNLIKHYEYVRRTFFPRFDRNNIWIVKYRDDEFHRGYCDLKNKRILINSNINDSELVQLLIHEIAHAVTGDYHAKKWKNRMLKAAELAAKIRQNKLSESIKDEVELYKETPGISPERAVYNSIEDCVIDSPESSFEKIISHVANYFGFYPEEFERRFKRCRRIYEETKKFVNDGRKIKAQFSKT